MNISSLSTPSFVETKRLLIRKPRIEDAETIYESNTQAIRTYLELNNSSDLSAICHALLKAINAWNSATRFDYILEEKSTGSIIGIIRLDPDTTGLDIILAEDKHGLDYISESINGICTRFPLPTDSYPSPNRLHKSSPEENRLTSRFERTLRYRLQNRRVTFAPIED